MKLVYIASPYKAIQCSDRDRPYYAKQAALMAAKKVKEAGFIPLSPILAFEGIYKEETERNRALAAGLTLLKNCDYIYVAKHCDSPKSEGIALELQKAKEWGIAEIALELL